MACASSGKLSRVCAFLSTVCENFIIRGPGRLLLSALEARVLLDSSLESRALLVAEAGFRTFGSPHAFWGPTRLQSTVERCQIHCPASRHWRSVCRGAAEWRDAPAAPRTAPELSLAGCSFTLDDDLAVCRARRAAAKKRRTVRPAGQWASVPGPLAGDRPTGWCGARECGTGVARVWRGVVQGRHWSSVMRGRCAPQFDETVLQFRTCSLQLPLPFHGFKGTMVCFTIISNAIKSLLDLHRQTERQARPIGSPPIASSDPGRSSCGRVRFTLL